MEKSERVVSNSRYNYYVYYNLYKERYKMNYELRKKKNELDIKYINYCKDYWLNKRWKNEDCKQPVEE